MKRLNLLIMLLILFIGQAEAKDVFKPYELWPDTDGLHINAHGGGVLSHGGLYYWYGEFKDRGSKANYGIACYSSKDLYNWKNCGIVLKVGSRGSEIEKGCVMERPKVIYNSKTKKFVMWFHLELKGRGYDAARTGVAISDKATGPFKYIKSYRPVAGHWPVDLDKDKRQALSKAEFAAITAGKEHWQLGKTEYLLQRDFTEGQMARDMTLFVDDDGKAYHISASEENQTLHICQLSDDYLSFTGRYSRVLIGQSNEAPAICKYKGKYYMLSSGCTGWAANEARSAMAKNILGPWKPLGNPCRGVNPHNKLGPEKTFGAQSTYILPVSGKDGAFIAMFDIWRPSNQRDSRYLWLPAIIEDGRLIVQWQDQWDLSWFDGDKSGKDSK
ncbi:MAG: family 43 glycosylhydrolase [Phycisphaerae bacterium]|nr:family 43 glycosylhydrolase [Phycisphaerae bacterium]